MQAMAIVLISKITKEKVLYTRKVFSTSAQFYLAAQSKTGQDLLSVTCVPPTWGWKTKQRGTNPPKSWVVHIMLSAARPLGSAVVVSIRLGSAWLFSALLLPLLCQLPSIHAHLVCHSSALDPAVGLGSWPWDSTLYICTSLYWRGMTVSCYNLGQSSWL